MGRLRTTNTPSRTIAEELLNLWVKSKRKKDVEKIMALAKEKSVPSSRPTIEKALLYGHVLDEGLRDLITTFFSERDIAEKQQAKDLKTTLAKK